MSTARRVIKNTGFLYAKMGITMFISLYTTRLILNTLGASDFGIFNIVGGVIAMMGFLNAAMATSTQRFMSFTEGKGDKKKQKQIFNVSLTIHSGIAVIMAVILLITGFFVFNGILNIPAERISAAKSVYHCMIVTTMITISSSTYEAVLNSNENMFYHSIVGIIESFLKLAGTLMVVYTSSDKLITYGILNMIISLLSLCILVTYCHKHYAECIFKPKSYFKAQLMKDMTSFAGWNFLGTSSGILTIQGMSFVLNHFFGVVANASHGIASQLSGQLMAFSNNMLKALNPAIVKSEGANNRERMLKASITGNKVSFILLAFFAIPFIIEMPYILNMWLKITPEYAIIFCRLVLARMLINQLYVTFPIAIGATGKIKGYVIADSIIYIFPIPLSIVLYLSGFPAYTIYVSMLIMAFARLANSLHFMKKLCNLEAGEYLKIVFSKCILILLITIIFSSFFTIILTEGFGRLVIISLSSSIIISILVHLILLSTEEKKIFSSLSGKIYGFLNQKKLKRAN